MLPASFALVLFTSGTAALVWLGILLAQCLFRQPVSFGGKLLGSAFFLLPATMPGLSLLYMHVHWLDGFAIAARVWGAGTVLAMALTFLRWFMGFCCVRRYPIYSNPMAVAALCHCAEQLNIPQKPRMIRSDRHGVAGVYGVWKPVIIVNPMMLEKLSEEEMAWVFRHELTHLRRRHTLWLRLLDLLCCVHWFNPFAWIAKRELEIGIEMDCDARVLQRYPDAYGYAEALLSVLHLGRFGKATKPSLEMIGYFYIRQRFEHVVKPPACCRKITVWVVTLAMIAAVMLGAIHLSQSYFYPYPAQRGEAEYAVELAGAP